MITRKVRQYIDEHRLLRRDEGVLVALSGGADSVALLRILLSLGYVVEAAHCNFRLRAGESDADEDFVRRLCARLGVPLHVQAFDTAGEALRHHESVEMAARRLRYAWFERVRLQRGLQATAVAHHGDDSAETLLLNLIRGTGIRGLQGIAPRRGSVVRPLLCLSRADILAYLSALEQDYVTDSTNLSDQYVRNQIRHHVIPALQAINPSAVQALLSTAQHLHQANLVYQCALEEGASRVCRALPAGAPGYALVDRADADVPDAPTDVAMSVDPACARPFAHVAVPADAAFPADDATSAGFTPPAPAPPMAIDLTALGREPSPEALLHHLLSPLGFNAAQLVDIARSLGRQAGRQFNARGWTVIKDRDTLYVLKTEGQGPDDSENPGPREGHSEQRVTGVDNLLMVPGPSSGAVGPTLSARLIDVGPDYQPPRDAHMACLDAGLLHLPLIVRPWQKGDSLVPLGMHGRKLVSDLLTDCKLPLHLRQRGLVVCSGADIVWVVGLRISHLYRVRPQTRRVLMMWINPKSL